MSKAVKMPYGSGTLKRMQIQFRGYNHTESCMDGEIWDERNMSGASWPLLRPVRNRPAFAHDAGNGMFRHTALGWISGEELWYDDHLVGYVADSKKTITAMGGRILIWPDKVVLNATYKRLGTYSTLELLQSAQKYPQEGDAYGVGYVEPYEIYVWDGKDWISNGLELENLEVIRGFQGATFKSGTYKGVPADANTMEFSVNVEDMGFREGDAVSISGCTKHPENNKTAIIREIEGKQLRFYENAFLLDGADGLTDYRESGTITISRTLPDLEVICAANNRLWGVRGDTIYASALGDPFNFNVFDGLTTDSWFQTTGTAGDFTGACVYLGYPMFFKEEHIFKIYGANAENFQFSMSATSGVKAGASKSLAIAGEVLYYLSPNGLTAYTGGLPESAADPFGDVNYKTAVCGSDGRRLYMSAQRQDNDWELFCLDTENGLLRKEDGLQAECFCRFGGTLYAVSPDGAVVVNADSDSQGCPDSWVEFGDFTEGQLERKGVRRLQLRVMVEQSAELTIKIQYDTEQFWRTVKVLAPKERHSYYLPVLPRRCDTYRLRLEGKGYWELQAMAREYYTGSGVH